jgi:hypothetical protein
LRGRPSSHGHLVDASRLNAGIKGASTSFFVTMIRGLSGQPRRDPSPRGRSPHREAGGRPPGDSADHREGGQRPPTTMSRLGGPGGRPPGDTADRGEGDRRSPSSVDHLVGLAGFEPATSATQTRRASQTALQPVPQNSVAVRGGLVRASQPAGGAGCDGVPGLPISQPGPGPPPLPLEEADQGSFAWLREGGQEIAVNLRVWLQGVVDDLVLQRICGPLLPLDADRRGDRYAGSGVRLGIG